jgi:hypothetical protein
MKIIVAVLLSIIVCFSNTSCQKEFSLTDVDSSLITLPPGTQPPGVSGSFTAKIDGVQFVGDKFAAATRALDVIAITALSVGGEQIVLRVADSGVHVYSLDINSATNVAAYSKDNGIAFTTNGGNSAVESGGTLSVTSIDEVNKKISGTFSVKVYRPLDSKQKIITEGVFTNISYETTAIPPANALDTFRVKVDGTQFPVSSITGISVFGMINISSSNLNVSKTVGLSFKSDVTPGTYDLSLFGLEYIGQYNVGTSYMAANPGTLTIIEHNTTTKRIRGNFKFHAAEIIGANKAELTEGYFSVHYN